MDERVVLYLVVGGCHVIYITYVPTTTLCLLLDVIFLFLWSPPSAFITHTPLFHHIAVYNA